MAIQLGNSGWKWLLLKRSEIENGEKQSKKVLPYLSVVGYNSEFTRYTISKATVMPSLPSVATVVLSHGISVHSERNPGEGDFTAYQQCAISSSHRVFTLICALTAAGQRIFPIRLRWDWLSSLWLLQLLLGALSSLVVIGNTPILPHGQKNSYHVKSLTTATYQAWKRDWRANNTTGDKQEKSILESCSYPWSNQPLTFWWQVMTVCDR